MNKAILLPFTPFLLAKCSKRTILSLLLLLLLCLRFQIPASAYESGPYELISAATSEPDSVDPAWAYDTASSELILNVYETLVFFDRESVDSFVPMLAAVWHISEDGLSYIFKIRQGVRFHDGETLTTEDVEYSFERAMVQDRRGGPAWMLYEALLGCWEANLSDPDWGVKIDNAVQRNATHVWFNLAKVYAPFPAILSQSWCSIVSKKFCVQHGDWPGTWDEWQNFHAPEVSPLDSPEPVMCGTGPYMLDYWQKGLEWSIIKFDEYWGGWPAHGCRGYVKRAAWKIEDWRMMFLNRWVDIAYVPRANITAFFGRPGIRCIYPLPVMDCGGLFFNYDISLSSPFLKPPYSVELDYGELNESGIPPDFFSDVDVRKAFAYLINYTDYILTGLLGEASYPVTPAITGLPYRNPEQERYEFNLTKAEEHFRKAWNGELWTVGFRLTISGYKDIPWDLPRKVICEMLKANVESLNPKFHIEIYVIDPWEDTYLPEMVAGELPLFIIDLYADCPDPHYLFCDFMHSQGLLTSFQRYSNATVDASIEEGLHTINEMRRKEIYYGLQQTYFGECPSVAIYQKTERHWEQTWVQGWYYNPAYPGIYVYHLWKEDLPSEDLDSDGRVNILDVALVAKAFGSCCALPDVHPRWRSRTDLNQDQKVDFHDLAIIACKFGYTSPPWAPP